MSTALPRPFSGHGALVDLLWLQAVEKISGALCMGCGAEDRPLVFAQHAE
jgi:hypothetical protein